MSASLRSRAVTGIVMAASILAVASVAVAQEGDDTSRHPSVRIGSMLRLEALARLQLDARLRSPRESSDDEGWDVARKRVGLRGRVGRVVAFELEGELEADSPWRDAYVEYRQFDALRARAGRFKVPFNRDQSTSSTNLDFIDRSLAAEQLAPRRDTGVMVHGRVWRGRVKYETGVFGKDSTVAFRLSGVPFAAGTSPLSRFTTALAIVSSTGDERLAESVWINGPRRRAGLELRWVPGPFALTTEYTRAVDARLGQSVEGKDLTALVRAGWYVTGVWTFRRPIGIKRTRMELAERVEGLRAGSGSHIAAPGFSGAAETFGPRPDVVAGRQERALTIGANWLFVPWVKVQVNAIRHTGRVSGAPERSDGRWNPVLRFQFTL